MKKLTFYSFIVLLALGLLSCEGNSDDGYDNAGLTEEEQEHTRAIIDSSLVTLKHDMDKADSITHDAMKKEIESLRAEIELLKNKKK